MSFLAAVLFQHVIRSASRTAPAATEVPLAKAIAAKGAKAAGSGSGMLAEFARDIWVTSSR